MKLADIQNKSVHATELEGVFIRDLTLDKLEELSQLESSEDATAPLLWLFQNLICDEQGDLFEDVQDEEGIKAVPMMKVKAITEAAMEAMQQGGKS